MVWKRLVVVILAGLLKNDIFLDFDDDLDLVGRLDVKLSIESDFLFFTSPCKDELLLFEMDFANDFTGACIISSEGNFK